MKGYDPLPSSAATGMAHVIRAFYPAANPTGDSELTGLYHSALHGQRALLLFDNVADDAQARPLTPPPGCILIITSRDALALPGATRFTVEQLQPGEARDLLCKVAGRKMNADMANRICALCGYLPLALRAAGSSLAVSPDLDPLVYATQLNEDRTRLERIGGRGAELPVEASINLSFRRVDADTTRLFCRLAVFPSSFDADSEELICEDVGHAHLTNLVGRSLVQYDSDSKRYRLHDLVRLFAKSRLDKHDELRTRKVHAAFYVAVAETAETLYYHVGGKATMRGLELFDVEWANIESGQAWAAANADGDDGAAKLCSRYPEVATNCLSLRLPAARLVNWSEAALAAARRLNDRGAIGRHLGSLGLRLSDLGQYQRALEFLEQSLPILRETDYREGEAAILHDLGWVYAAIGESRRALVYYQEALVIHRKLSNRKGIAATLNSIGAAYSTLGENKEAVQFHKEALSTALEADDRLCQGRALGCLGNCLLGLGDPLKAIRFFEQGQTILNLLGDRVGHAMLKLSLGKAYSELHDDARAIEAFEEAARILEEMGDRGTGYGLGKPRSNVLGVGRLR
jgi:tetratricopeptide (TPR) repeat protein